MIQVIPAIIAKNFEELEEKINQIAPFSQWIQLDVMDGQFVPNTTFDEPDKIKKIAKDINIEVHLMIKEPSAKFEKWLENGAKRVIVHWESLGGNKEKELSNIVKKVKTLRKELGLAINPQTSFKEVRQYIPKVDLLLLMAVHPGFGGQTFLTDVLKKIREARQEFKNLNIEVDGGINQETAKRCIEAGANILVSGSYIFGGDIKKRLENLKNG